MVFTQTRTQQTANTVLRSALRWDIEGNYRRDCPGAIGLALLRLLLTLLLDALGELSWLLVLSVSRNTYFGLCVDSVWVAGVFSV